MSSLKILQHLHTCPESLHWLLSWKFKIQLVSSSFNWQTLPLPSLDLVLLAVFTREWKIFEIMISRNYFSSSNSIHFSFSWSRLDLPPCLTCGQAHQSQPQCQACFRYWTMIILKTRPLFELSLPK